MKKKKDPRISWQIEEYTHREKTPDWYWALGIIASASAVIAVIYDDALFAVIIILSALIMGYYAARKPDIIEISINEDGINFRNEFYEFEKIKGFAIEEHVMGNKLLVESNRSIVPILSIPLPSTLDTEALFTLLQTKIPEKELTEPVSHRLFEHMGF